MRVRSPGKGNTCGYLTMRFLQGGVSLEPKLGRMGDEPAPEVIVLVTTL